MGITGHHSNKSALRFAVNKVFGSREVKDWVNFTQALL